MPSDAASRLILYSRAGCCLCDRLEGMLQAHLPRLAAKGYTLEKRDLGSHAEWEPVYGDRIPVLTLAGRVLLEGRPEEPEVRQALADL